MKLIDPDYDSLYAVPNDGAFKVVGVASDGKGLRLPDGPRPMSVEQHGRFEAGRRLLRGLLAIEEAYDVTMGNYLDLEETVLRLSAREMAQRRPHGREDHFDTARRSCHRALANLLSASKAYQDQSQRLASSIDEHKSADDLAALRTSLSAAYDASLGYRVMSALRNHTQHHGVSVSGVSMTRAVTDPAGESSDQFVTTMPYLRLSELRENGKFKANILEEVEQIAESGPWAGDKIVPLIPLVRQAMAGLSSVMVAIRQLYRNRETQALSLLYAAFYQYSGFFTQQSPVGLVVSVTAIDGTVTYFGTDDHFKARALREVNGELSLLPLTEVRQ